MSKANKFVVAGIFTILLILAGRIVFQYITTIPCQYAPYFGSDNRYHWLFQDSIVKDLDKFYSVGNVNEAIYAYNYKKDFRIIIWELPESNLVDLKNIKYNWDINIERVIISPQATGSIENDPEITIESKLCPSFYNGIIGFNLGQGSKIFRELMHNEYASFYGQFDKVGIVDENNDYQIVFTYSKIIAMPAELIFYKGRNSFFIIIINAIEKGQIDENTISILKL